MKHVCEGEYECVFHAAEFVEFQVAFVQLGVNDAIVDNLVDQAFDAGGAGLM